jgi:hypothetical protein
LLRLQQHFTNAQTEPRVKFESKNNYRRKRKSKFQKNSIDHLEIVNQILSLDSEEFGTWSFMDWVEKADRVAVKINKDIVIEEKSNLNLLSTQSHKRKLSPTRLQQSVVKKLKDHNILVNEIAEFIKTDEMKQKSPISKEIWYTKHKEYHFRQLFPGLPNSHVKHYSWHVSTDGVQVRHHLQRNIPVTKSEITKTKKGKYKYAPIIVSEEEKEKNEKEYYQKMQPQVRSWLEKKKVIIAVDPGHKDLITAVRHLPENFVYQNNSSEISENISSSFLTKKQKRRLAKREREKEANQTTFTFSNKHYYEMCGYTSAAKKRLYWRKESGLSILDEELSQKHLFMNRTTFVMSLYQPYIQKITSLEWWTILWTEINSLKYRKLLFDVHKLEQQAGIKIARLLCQGDQLDSNEKKHAISDCVVLWGNGSFRSTSKGHAAAPNKKLRDMLKKAGVEIHLVDEYLTSQRTACCHAESVHAKDFIWTKKKDVVPDEEKKEGDKTQKTRESNKKRQIRLLYCHCHQTSSSSTLAPSPLLISSNSTSAFSTVAPFSHHRVHDQNLVSSMILKVAPYGPSSAKRSVPWKRDICSALCIYSRFMYSVFRETPVAFCRQKLNKVSQSELSDLNEENLEASASDID